MHTCIPLHWLKRSWHSCWRQVNAGNKNTHSKYHPRRQNVITSMVGLKNCHICKNLTQNSEPQRSSWGMQKKKKIYGPVSFLPELLIYINVQPDLSVNSFWTTYQITGYSELSLWSLYMCGLSFAVLIVFLGLHYFFHLLRCNNSTVTVVSPHGLAFTRGGVSRLSLPTPFSPIFVCPSAYWNLSPVLLFTHQLLPTYLQFSSSDCPFCLHRPFTYISLLYKPSFCHFSFSLWSTRDPARWPCAVTRVVGGWDPGDWGRCWAAAPQYQHITSTQTSARREVRKARPDQSVGGISLVGVFHRGQLGVSNPWVYFVHSPGVTLPDIRREIDIPLLDSVAGGEWIKWNENEHNYGPQKQKMTCGQDF